jgi:hypothetical protein
MYAKAFEESTVSIFYLEDGGSRFFRKVDKDLPEYTVSHLRARLSQLT